MSEASEVVKTDSCWQKGGGGHILELGSCCRMSLEAGGDTGTLVVSEKDPMGRAIIVKHHSKRLVRELSNDAVVACGLSESGFRIPELLRCCCKIHLIARSNTFSIPDCSNLRIFHLSI
jgi:hypothetical protein